MKPLALALILLLQAGAESPSRIQIQKGREVTVDGLISAGEWDDAESLNLQADDGWTVEVRYKHDGTNILFAFIGAGSRTVNGQQAFRFPELLIDPADKKSVAWESGQWWLHASANDCEGNGEYNVYRRDGKFLCSKEKPGWRANNFPYANPSAIEISVSFEKLGIKPDSKKSIGLAMNVTDTRSSWTFWPVTAKLESPATWGRAILQP